MIIIPESKIQQEAYNWFNNNYCLKHHKPSYIIHSVPNGIPIPIPPKERARALDLLKKTGMVNGISDLIIHAPGGKCIMAECKTEGGYQSDDQKEIERKIIELGGVYFVFRSLIEFQTKIKLYL